MTRDNNDSNDVDRILNALKDAKSWYEDNKDLFAGAGAAIQTMDMETPDPLTEAHVSQDEVKIVAEVKDSDINQMAVGFSGGKMSCEVGSREFVVDVPNDVDEDSIHATVQNGVLSVTLDRISTGEKDVEVTTKEEMDNTVEELFDDEDNGGDEDGSDE